jgi:hypothetical protein
VSVPTASAPAATGIEALPLVRLVAAEVKLPLVNTTVPVGVALAPVTATVTVVPCAVVMLDGDAEAATVAVAVPVVAPLHPFTTLATFSEPSPVASSYAVPAANPVSTPTVSPLVDTVQFGDPAVHGIAFVPVSMSLK